VVVERDIVLPFLQGKEIKPFSIQASGKVVIIPYKISQGRVELISINEFRTKLPKTFDYLLANKKFLEQREGGRMCGDNWYGFIYPKNLEVMAVPKLLVPDIANRASFALDEEGDFAFTSGYGITLKPTTKASLTFILGLVDSHVLDFYWRQISTPLRGGFYRYFTQFIEQLPIPAASDMQQTMICLVVDYLLWLNRQPPVPGDTRDPLMLGYFEQLLNGLIYELFFPDELHAQKLFFCRYAAEARLPVLAEFPEVQRLAVLRETFERIYNLNHPIRGCLFSLGSLETVRIIEGEA
jgi:hypothetical protein